MKQCVQCGHQLRPAKVPLTKAPGTRQHGANGSCKSCYDRDRRAAGAAREPEMFGYVFDERQAASALEAWLSDRRRRIATQGAAA